jgi:hypothetical protein
VNKKIGFAAVSAVAATGVFVTQTRMETLDISNQGLAAPTAPDIRKDIHSGIQKRIALRFFGHMMVPAGLHNLYDLERASPLYPGFQIEKAQFTTLKYGMFAYVSYRLNNKTYYTKHVRFILAGEPIVTDGMMIMLQRCGNIIVNAAPPELVREDDPIDVYPPVSLNIPVDALTAPIIGDVVGPPPVVRGQFSQSPWMTPYGVVVASARFSG